MKSHQAGQSVCITLYNRACAFASSEQLHLCAGGESRDGDGDEDEIMAWPGYITERSVSHVRLGHVITTIYRTLHTFKTGRLNRVNWGVACDLRINRAHGKSISSVRIKGRWRHPNFVRTSRTGSTPAEAELLRSAGLI